MKDTGNMEAVIKMKTTVFIIYKYEWKNNEGCT